MQVYTNRVRLFLFGIYVNVYLRGKQILYNEVATLWQEEEKVKRFPMADKEEIFQFDDVCAICLGGMKNARKTHCKHLFHDHCLSLAVQASPNCPTCKAILQRNKMKYDFQFHRIYLQQKDLICILELQALGQIINQSSMTKVFLLSTSSFFFRQYEFLMPSILQSPQ